jgi:replicative DNA helicase
MTQMYDGPPAGGRVPPHSYDAEESLLGAMMIARDTVASVAAVVEPEDFYRPLHGQIFAAMVDLDSAGLAIDTVTLLERLAARGVTNVEMGLIATLATNVATPRNAEQYAAIVRDKSRQRSLIAAGMKIIDDAYAPTDDVRALFDDAESAIMRLADQDNVDSMSPLSPLIAEELALLEARGEEGKSVNGLATGYRRLDLELRGISKTALAVIGARPSIGKTAFALGILRHVGVVEQRPALFFSLEMGRIEVAERILAATAEIDGNKLKIGALSNVDWDKAQRALTELSTARIFIDDNPSLTVMDIRSRARRVKQQEKDLGVVIVDYLQLMSSRKNSENRQVEVAEMSRGLKILARELECPVIALSQLNRSSQTGNRRPMMADLRESGAIEQDADIVMFLHRGGAKEDNAASEQPTYRDEGKVEVIIAKNRNGSINTIELAWEAPYARFRDMPNFD